MNATAAVDRLVHHYVVLELNLSSCNLEVAHRYWRSAEQAPALNSRTTIDLMIEHSGTRNCLLLFVSDRPIDAPDIDKTYTSLRLRGSLHRLNEKQLLTMKL